MLAAADSIHLPDLHRLRSVCPRAALPGISATHRPSQAFPVALGAMKAPSSSSSSSLGHGRASSRRGSRVPGGQSILGMCRGSRVPEVAVRWGGWSQGCSCHGVPDSGGAQVLGVLGSWDAGFWDARYQDVFPGGARSGGARFGGARFRGARSQAPISRGVHLPGSQILGFSGPRRVWSWRC